MLRTRFRKVFRDLWSRKVRTALVSLSILIGVFGTVTLFTMGDLLVRQLRQDLKQDQLAMVRAYVTLSPNASVDNAAVLDLLRAQPGVTRVEGQAVAPISWKKAGDAGFQSSWVFGHSEPFDQIQLEPMRLIRGNFPAVGQQQIAIERRFADKYGLDVGDTITVRILSQAADDTVPEEQWTISGVVFFPYGYNSFSPIIPAESLFAAFADAQYIGGFQGFSSVYARYVDFATAEANADALIGTIAAATPYIPIFNITEDPAQNSLIRFSETVGGTMGSLGLLALIVSGFLVFNVLVAIVTEQKAQIGIMKAVGASRWDNFVIYSGIAFVYGLIGVVPGVLLAIPSGFFAAQGLAESSNSFIEEFGVSTSAIVLGIVVGLAIPVLASLLPVWSGTGVKIIDAITDLGIASTYGHSALARFVGRLPVPITVRQGISNVLRKKGRTAFTTLTLLIAAGAFMGVFAVFSSIDEVVRVFFDTYDYHLSVTPNDLGQLDQAQNLIQQAYPDLTLKGPFSSIAIEIDGFDKEFDPTTGPPALFANGYDPASGGFDIILQDGRSLADDPDGVIVSRITADYLDRQTGDTLTIRAGKNQDEFRIVGIGDFPYDNVWFRWETLSTLAGYVDANGQPLPSGLLFSMPAQDPTADQVEDVIEDLDQLLLANGIPSIYGNAELFKETLAETITTFQLVFNFTAILIALVGAVGLLTTLSMSVFERQKEIGVMRSVGAGSVTIVTQFLTEGFLIGGLAWLIGLPLSYFLAQGLLATIGLGDAYPLRYPAAAPILGLVGTLLVTLLAALWPSVSAARKTVSNILRYQ